MEKFDPYGSVLPADTRDAEPPMAISKGLSRIGQYVFWLLVIVIVGFRVAYFPTGFPPHGAEVREATSEISGRF